MKSNTRFNKNTKGIACLNCKQPMASVDNFCSDCGQVNDTKPLSIKQYISELLGGFFAFDTRTLNTLKPLLFKPGKVSKDYINGERMKYVNPFQLYLHVSIIFFLVTSIFMGMDKYHSMVSKNNDGDKNSAVDDVIIGWNMVGETKKDSTNITVFQHIVKQSKDLTSDKTFTKTVTDTILSKKQKDKIIHKLVDNNINRLYKESQKDSVFKKHDLYNKKKFKKAFVSNFQKEINVKNIDYEFNAIKESNDITTSSPWLNKYAHFFNSKTKNAEKAIDSLGYKRTDKNIFFFKKLQEAKKATKGGDAGRSFLSNMISKLSLVLFFMLPLFTLFLSLLYIRRKFNYTENLIFVFNVQTVFFILVLIGILFDRLFNTSIGTLIAIPVFLFYLYKAMRKFYNQKRFKTVLKFIILNGVYFILSVFGIFLVAFLAIII